MIVLDASAIVEWLLRTPTGDQVERRIFSRAVSLHAPHLLDIEVAHVMRRCAASGVITPSRGEEALEDLADISLTRYPHYVLLGRIWELRANLTAYDAAYIALSEALDAPLLTCDSRVARASGHRARIEVIYL